MLKNLKALQNYLFLFARNIRNNTAIAVFVLPMHYVAQKWILHFWFWTLSKATSGGQIRNCDVTLGLIMNSMKIVIPLHFISWKKDSKRCCDTTIPESIHTKDESKLRFSVCFHLWCELTTTISVTEWQVSWNSCTTQYSVIYVPWNTQIWRNIKPILLHWTDKADPDRPVDTQSALPYPPLLSSH